MRTHLRPARVVGVTAAIAGLGGADDQLGGGTGTYDGYMRRLLQRDRRAVTWIVH